MKVIYTTILFIVVSLTTISLNAQQLEWHKTYENEIVVDWTIFQDHIFMIGENTLSKYDLEGNEILEIDPQFENKVTQQLITSSYIYISSRNQIHKSYANGDAFFQKDIENPVDALSFVVDEQDYLYVCWEDYSYIWLSKYDNEGELLFEKKIFSSQDVNTRAHTMAIDNDGHLVISGYHCGTELSDGNTNLSNLKAGKKAF
ncbi:MAG: hypothetical protein JEZ03_02655, partial [Bacteroidales bacterium]|nr:hypothetical protein [Bacteroidales bacterium]